MDQIADFNALKSFSIPKRSNLNNEILQVLDAESREYKDILQTFSDAARSKPSINKFSFLKIYHVRNQGLEEEFLERRKFFKTFKDGSATKVAPSFFLVHSLKEAKAICSHGLKVGNSKLRHLGDPEKGVYLCKYSDIIQPQPFMNDQCGFIIGFNVIKGRVKFMDENHSGDPLDPTPDFECHLSKSLSKLDKDSQLSVLYDTSQVYVFEYDEYLEIQKHPRHVLPIFVIHFRYQSKEERTFFKRERPKKEKLISNITPRGVPPISKSEMGVPHVLWKGDLYIQGSNITGLSLYSIITFPKPDSFLAQTLEVIESVDMQFCFINYNGLDKLGRIGFGIPVTMGNKCYHRAEMRVVGPVLPIHTNLVAFLESTMKCMVIKLGANLFLLLLPDCNFVTQNLGYTSDSDKCILHGMIINHIMPLQDYSREFTANLPQLTGLEQKQQQQHLTSEDDEDEDVDFDIIKLKKHAGTTVETPRYDPFSDNGEATTSEDENKLLQKLLSSTGINKVPHFSALSSRTVGNVSMSQDLIDDIVLKQPLNKETSASKSTEERFPLIGWRNSEGRDLIGRQLAGWSEFEFDSKNDQSDDIIKCKDLKRSRKVRKQLPSMKYSEDDDDTPISRYYKTKSVKSSMTSDNDDDNRSNYSSSVDDTKYNHPPAAASTMSHKIPAEESKIKRPKLSSIVMSVNKSGTPVESILSTAFKNAQVPAAVAKEDVTLDTSLSLPYFDDSAVTRTDIHIGGGVDHTNQGHLPKFNFSRLWGDGGSTSELKSFVSSRLDDIDNQVLESVLRNSPMDVVLANSPMESFIGNSELISSVALIIPTERLDDKVPDIVEGKVRLSLEYDMMLENMKISIGENELLRRINIESQSIFIDEAEQKKINFKFVAESVEGCFIRVMHQRLAINKIQPSGTFDHVDVNQALHSFKQCPDTRNITILNDKLKITVAEDNKLGNIYHNLFGPELFERGRWKIKRTNFLKLYSDATNKSKSIPFLDDSDFIPGLNLFSTAMPSNKVLPKWPSGLKIVDVDPNGFQRKKTGKLPDIVGIEIITICDPRLSRDISDSSIYHRNSQDFWRRYHQATEEAWLLKESGKYYVKIDNGAVQLVLKVNPCEAIGSTPATTTAKPPIDCKDKKVDPEDNIPNTNIFSKKFKKHHKFKTLEPGNTKVMPTFSDIPLPVPKEKQTPSIVTKTNESNDSFLVDNNSLPVEARTLEKVAHNVAPKNMMDDKSATEYDSDLEARLAEKERLKAEILLLEQRVKQKKLEKARRIGCEGQYNKALLDTDDFSFSSDSTNLSESFEAPSIMLSTPQNNIHPLLTKVKDKTDSHEVLISSIKTEIFDNFNVMLNEITGTSLSIQQPDSTSTFINDVKANDFLKNSIPCDDKLNCGNIISLDDNVAEDLFLDEMKSRLLMVNTACGSVVECEPKMSPDSSNRIENCQDEITKKEVMVEAKKVVELWDHFDGLSAATQFEGQFYENPVVRDTLLKEIREWLKKKPLENIALGKTGLVDISTAVLQKQYPNLDNLIQNASTLNSSLYRIITSLLTDVAENLKSLVEMCEDGRWVDYFKEMEELDIINAQNNSVEDNLLTNQVLRANLVNDDDNNQHDNDTDKANLNRSTKEGEKSSEDFDFMNDRINAQIKTNFEKVYRKIKKRKIKKLKPIHKSSGKCAAVETKDASEDAEFDVQDANKWLDDSFIEKCILEANKAVEFRQSTLPEPLELEKNKYVSNEKKDVNMPISKVGGKPAEVLDDLKFTKEFDVVADQILENVYTSRLEREKEKKLQLKERIKERMETIINDKIDDGIRNNEEENASIKIDSRKLSDGKRLEAMNQTFTIKNDAALICEGQQKYKSNKNLDRLAIDFYAKLFGEGNDMFSARAVERFRNTMPSLNDMLSIDKCFLWALGLGLFNEEDKEYKKPVKSKKICKQIVDSFEKMFTDEIEDFYNSVAVEMPYVINCEDIELPPPISNNNNNSSKVAEKAKIKFAFGGKRRFIMGGEEGIKRKKSATEGNAEMFTSDEELEELAIVKSNPQQDVGELDLDKTPATANTIKPLMGLTDLAIITDDKNLKMKYDMMSHNQQHYRRFNIRRRFDHNSRTYETVGRSRSDRRSYYWRRSRSGDVTGSRHRQKRSFSSSSSSTSSSRNSRSQHRDEPKRRTNEVDTTKKRVFKENPEDGDGDNDKLVDKVDDAIKADDATAATANKNNSKAAPTPFPKFLQKFRQNQLASRKLGHLAAGEDGDSQMDKFPGNSNYNSDAETAVDKNDKNTEEAASAEFDIFLDKIQLPEVNAAPSMSISDIDLNEIILPSADNTNLDDCSELIMAYAEYNMDIDASKISTPLHSPNMSNLGLPVDGYLPNAEL